MTKVLFNQEDEFIKELQTEFQDHPANIVRITNCLKTYPKLAPIQALILEASAKSVDGKDIITLERYCGDIWNIEKQDVPVIQKAEEVRARITEVCEELFLTVRGGVYLEEAKTA